MACDDWKHQMAELVETAAVSVERLVNGGGEENRKELVSRLGSMHRTLQQRLIGEIVIPLVRNMAARVESHNYDARNEYACKVCKTMLDSLKADYPFIANGECGLPLV